ncbi:MAG: phosphoribosylaminoimidazolesuccinocarboxamide synthase, partial [Euryarchaeota archaeon]|nr:phosphoribosylaminoimidazolesuccinocarboxamide synthase [Euryarchaeota archaeon]
MKLLYRGKAKSVFERDADTVVMEFRDDLTAGDGVKKETKLGKGSLNAEISAKFFEILKDKGIKTHFINFEEPNKHVVKKVKIIPLEVICRNIAAGSLVRRYPFKEGQELSPPTIEMGYKSDEYHDPLLNDEIALALGAVRSRGELEKIREITLKVNKILKEFLLKKGIILVDFKLEFGYDSKGNLLLAD